MKPVGALCVGLVVLGSSAPSFAQPEQNLDEFSTESERATDEDEKDPVAASPPDIVILHDGGMVRGTITEHIAGKYVEIETSRGKHHRFDAAEYTYAGPAADAPSHERQSATPSEPREELPVGELPATPAPDLSASSGSQLRLLSTGPRVTFLVRSSRYEATVSGFGTGVGLVSADIGMNEYSELCTTPCSTQLPEGSYVIALSRSDGDFDVEERVDIPAGDHTIRARYEDPPGRTILGWTLLGAGLVGFGGLFYLAAEEQIEPVLAGIGMVGSGVLIVAGSHLLLTFGTPRLTIQEGHEAARLRPARRAKETGLGLGAVF